MSSKAMETSLEWAVKDDAPPPYALDLEAESMRLSTRPPSVVGTRKLLPQVPPQKLSLERGESTKRHNQSDVRIYPRDRVRCRHHSHSISTGTARQPTANYSLRNHRSISTSLSTPNVRSSSYTHPLSNTRSSTLLRQSPPSEETYKAVKSTVVDLLRDITRPPTSQTLRKPRPDPDIVLGGVREACNSYSLSFPDVIQEKCIEGHTPIYWAILNKRSSYSDNLIMTLLAHSAPLVATTVADIRHAALLRNDKHLYQRLRCHPIFLQWILSPRDAMIFGNKPPDSISISQSQSAMFQADIKIAYFQRRMRVSGKVDLEFIAGNRLWHMSFIVSSLAKSSNKSPTPKPGDKCLLVLTTLEDSQSTFIDGVLLISDLSSSSCTPLLVPLHMPHELASIGTPKKSVRSGQKKEFSVTLDKRIHEYVSDTDCLKVKMEMRLRRPRQESGCIIC